MRTDKSRKSKNVIDIRDPKDAAKYKRKKMHEGLQASKAAFSPHLRDKTPIKDQKSSKWEKDYQKHINRHPFALEDKGKKLMSHKKTQVTPGDWKKGKLKGR